MTHIDITRQIRYLLLAELHRAAADLYAKQIFGTDAEIKAVVHGYDAALSSLYAHYDLPNQGSGETSTTTTA